MTDRPTQGSESEIEITPEMIEAGKQEVMCCWGVLAAAPSSALYEEVAISIYRAMHQSQPRFLDAAVKT